MTEKDINIEGEETLDETPLEETDKESAENAAEEAAADTQEEEKEEAEEKDPLVKAQEEIEELKDKWLRSVAEFENYRKRTIKEKAELILGGGEKTIKEILPVLDDFERALADKTEDPNAIREGMQLIFNKFVSTLEKMGVKKIETEGADFNVDFHEAIALVPGLGDEMKGKVIDCTKTGYTLNDKVIRHAQVAVGQ